VWTDPDSTGPCRPDAAAFVDLTRLVLRCGADGIGVLVERSGRAQPWVRDTVSSNDVRPRRPVVGTCSPRGRRVVADDRGSPVLAPCTPATLERSAVCPARGGDAATTTPRPVAVARARPPHFAGLQLDLYFEFSAQRSAQRRIEDMRPASDRAIDRGLTVVAGVRVGFDPTARPRWQRVHAAVERRRRARAADAAIRPRGCAREGQRR